MKIAIVTHKDVVSHLVTATRINEIFKENKVETTIYDYQVKEIPETNILYIGTVFSESLSYLARFLPEKKVVFYGTCEGFPILDPEGIERYVAEHITIIPVSNFVKLCLETVGLEPEKRVYHGIDMKDLGKDEKYLEYTKKYFEPPVVLCVAANSERKGLDHYITACKLVSREVKKAKFILHSSDGYFNIPKLIWDLELKGSWYTNAFGMMPETKMSSLYDLSTLYVQPSHTEGLGLPMIEAFRFNKPVVAVNAMPFNEVITNNKTGVLLELKGVNKLWYMDRFQFPMHQYSVDELADVMINLLTDDEKIRELAHNIEEEKHKFDISNTYPEILKAF